MIYLLAFLFPVAIALENLFLKKSLRNDNGDKLLDEFSLVFLFHVVGFVAILLFLPLLPYHLIAWSSVPGDFWWWLLLKVPSQIVALILYAYAIRQSLSRATPITLLTPVLIPFFGYFLIGGGELPSVVGWIGIALVLLGAYGMTRTSSSYGDVDKRSIRRAVFAMLIVALIWSLTSVVDKIATGLTNPTSYIFYSTIGILLGMLSVSFSLPKMARRVGWGGWKKTIETICHNRSILLGIILVGICVTGAEFIQMTLILAMPAAYVLTLKRGSIVFDALFGRILFQEKLNTLYVFALMSIFVGFLVLLFA